MRGRKPTPTHLKLVTGNPGKRAINKKEAKAAPALPSPPAHLTAEAKTEWRRLAPELHKAGLLTNLDRAMLAAYCEAYGRWVQASKALAKMAEKDPLTGALMIRTKEGNAVQNPLVGTANKAMSDMARYASEFGLSPSARSRISADPPTIEDDPSSRYFT